MLEYILVGIVSALIVFIPNVIFYEFPQTSLISPAILLLGVGLGPLFKKRLYQHYSWEVPSSGYGRLMEHVHHPEITRSSFRWFMFGMMSFILVFFGGCVGPEGAGIELTYALLLKMRTRSSRWFEQRRRTDSSASLASGLSATFASPFSAILLPIELGIGGKSMAVAASAFSAFVMSILLRRIIPLETSRFFDEFLNFNFLRLPMVENTILIGLASGVLSSGSVRFLRYLREGLQRIFKTLVNAQSIIALFLLYIICIIYDPASNLPWNLLRQIMWARHSLSELGLIYLLRLVSLSVVLACFGTLGIFWPLFLLGSIIGFSVNQLTFGPSIEMAPGACILGGAIFFGTLLRAPLTASVLALELTFNPEIMPLAALGGVVSAFVSKTLKAPSLLDEELRDVGVPLSDGRSVTLLDQLLVKDAMIQDHEVAYPRDSVILLHEKIERSPYPFIPVVDAKDRFMGILTLEMIQEKLRFQKESGGRDGISELIEAKDMLYRSGFPSSTIGIDEVLSATTGRFNDIPCLTVLDREGQVVGLLLVYHVRLAYDQEMIRRSFKTTS